MDEKYPRLEFKLDTELGLQCLQCWILGGSRFEHEALFVRVQTEKSLQSLEGIETPQRQLCSRRYI